MCGDLGFWHSLKENVGERWNHASKTDHRNYNQDNS